MYSTDSALQQLQQLHLDQRLRDAQEGMERINSKVLAFVKENPGTCILGAIAVGFLVGRVAARS